MPRSKQITALFLCLAYSLILTHDFTHIHHRMTGAVLEAVYCTCPCRMTACPDSCEHAADTQEKNQDSHAGNCEIIATPPVLRSVSEEKVALLPQDLSANLIGVIPTDANPASIAYTITVKRRIPPLSPYQNPIAPAYKSLRAPPAIA